MSPTCSSAFGSYGIHSWLGVVVKHEDVFELGYSSLDPAQLAGCVDQALPVGPDIVVGRVGTDLFGGVVVLVLVIRLYVGVDPLSHVDDLPVHHSLLLVEGL